MAGLLQLDGKRLLRMDGWPEGAEVVTVTIEPESGIINLFIYHPDFEIVYEGAIPPEIYITATSYEFPVALVSGVPV